MLNCVNLDLRRFPRVTEGYPVLVGAEGLDDAGDEVTGMPFEGVDHPAIKLECPVLTREEIVDLGLFFEGYVTLQPRIEVGVRSQLAHSRRPVILGYGTAYRVQRLLHADERARM